MNNFQPSQIEYVRTAINNYDIDTAFRLLCPAALGGDQAAQRLLSTLADAQEMLYNVEESSFTDVKAAADAGNAFAQYVVSRYYRMKHVDVTKEVSYAKQSAAQDCGGGWYALKQCYADGRGVDPDTNEASMCMAKAMAKEHPAAMLETAYLNLWHYIDPHDESYGLQLLKRCMELDVAESYSLMAQLRFYGRGVGQDADEGRRLFSLAISKGYPQAYAKWASEEHSLTGSEAERVRLLNQGVEHGVPMCHCYLADGQAETFPKQAAEHYQYAAIHGNTEACFKLGCMYNYNDESEMNLTEAWRWYSLGADLYDQDCLKAVCNLVKPSRLDQIIRPIAEPKNPSSEWFRGRRADEIYIYKERLVEIGAIDASRDAFDLYEYYSGKSGLDADKVEHIDMEKALNFLRRAIALGSDLSDMMELARILVDVKSPFCDATEGIHLLEEIRLREDARDKMQQVEAALMLAEIYSKGQIVDRNAKRAIDYYCKAIEIASKLILNPIGEEYYTSPSRYAQEKHGTEFLEQARQAISRADTLTAFQLLLEPAIDNYYEAQELITSIVVDNENLYSIPDAVFERVRELGGSFANYLLARYYRLRHADLSNAIRHAAKSAEWGEPMALYELNNCLGCLDRGNYKALSSKISEYLEQQGNPYALLDKAKRYLKQDTITIEADKEMRSILQQCMDRHIPKSFFLMAIAHYRDTPSIEKDEAKVEQFLQQAVSEGYKQAYLGMAYTVSRDNDLFHLTPQALQLIDRGIALGSVYSMAEKADYYADYFNGGAQDITKAIRYYTMAAERGLPDAMAKLGNIYYDSTDVAQCCDKAWLWYSRGAAMGDNECIEKLGEMCIEGNGGDEEEPRRGIEYLEQALLQFDEYALKAAQTLFCIYGSEQLDIPFEFNHVGYSVDYSCPTIEKDDAKAMQYLRYAADLQLSPEDSLYYGVLLTTPNTPFTDVAEGIKQLEWAMEYHEMHAAVRLGDLYAEGRVVEKDTQKARSYYTLAANRRCKLAQKRLARL